MPPQGVGVVLDRTAAAWEARRALMPRRKASGLLVDRDGLRHSQGPDQLEPFQALGAGFVLPPKGSRAYTAGSAGMSPSMCAIRKNPRTRASS